ncbi:MAG: VWA domain-containing protein [Isosphaerales bacterium]
MSWGVLNAAMLVGLLGAAVPVIIHLLNRRRGLVIDWGAMQFLEPGRLARRKIRLTELLLMLARMTLLAVVALALARPFWSRRAVVRGGEGFALAHDAPPRDIVLVLDGSDSMERRSGGTTPRALAVAWARRFAGQCRPGDSIALLVAGDRVRAVIDPPVFDRGKVDATLAGIKMVRGSSDLPAALAEAFRVLERTENPGRDVVVLTDGQRHAWRPGEQGRWALVRALERRLPVPPRIWSIAFGAGKAADAPNGSVGPLAVSRAIVTPGMPIEVTTTLENAGPGPLTRTAELLVDGLPSPGSAQVVGPIPAGGRAPWVFRTSLSVPGSHLLTVRLIGGDDALPGDDESAVPVEVTPALPVLLVDGEPGLEPFSGETDFLRAALAPTGDDTPQVRARVVTTEALNASALTGERVAVVANVARLAPEQVAALGGFVEAGGGLLIAPGDRTDARSWNGIAWMAARLGDLKGSGNDRKAIAHPAPRTFTGPLMTRFGQGDSPPLAEAGFFAYRVLTAVPGSAPAALFDTGDPWVVERPVGRGHVLVLSTAIDAEAGTLPVNPDFVPLVHEWVFHLAGGSGPPIVRAGEPLVFKLASPPAPDLRTLPLQTPDGSLARADVVRGAGQAQARFDDTSESGIYRLALPDPPGGAVYAAVARDARESDMTPLDPAEAARLSEGWPLAFEPDPDRLIAGLFAPEPGGKHEVWRLLVLAALGGLCLEIYLTRLLVRTQGLVSG